MGRYLDLARSAQPPVAPERDLLVERLLGLPLEEFARQELALRFRVPWLSVSLWLVQDATAAAQLTTEGVPRGAIWTVGEARDLLSLELTSGEALKVARFKLALGGEVSSLRPFVAG